MLMITIFSLVIRQKCQRNVKNSNFCASSDFVAKLLSNEMLLMSLVLACMLLSRFLIRMVQTLVEFLIRIEMVIFI